jgi:sulfur-oxidizing protein SoxX
MRRSAERAAAIAVLSCLLCGAAPLASYRIDGDSIAAELIGKPGDPDRGRSIVLDRQLGACLLCHSGPFPDPHLQGSIAPSLAGVGTRLTAGQIRLRLVDPRRLNADTLMPAYYDLDGLRRVGLVWQGKPILAADQIEDVVAFLMTLRTP